MIFWKTWSEQGMSVIDDIVHHNLEMLSGKEIEANLAFA